MINKDLDYWEGLFIGIDKAMYTREEVLEIVRYVLFQGTPELFENGGVMGVINYPRGGTYEKAIQSFNKYYLKKHLVMRRVINDNYRHVRIVDAVPIGAIEVKEFSEMKDTQPTTVYKWVKELDPVKLEGYTPVVCGGMLYLLPNDTKPETKRQPHE